MGGPPLFFCQSFGSCTRFFCYRKDAGDMEHSTEILYNRTAVYCSAEHRFGSDALLLSRFCAPKRAEAAVDLCSGCGIVALAWHDAGHRGPCAAVELQPPASALLQAYPAGLRRPAHLCPAAGPVGRMRLQPALFYPGPCRRQPRPGLGPARGELWAGGCVQLRVPAAAGRGQAGFVPPAGASGRGAGRFAGGTAGA